ncbi:MAG: hypothetical protein NVS4B8_29370 [Herpetosiphon sp.]
MTAPRRGLSLHDLQTLTQHLLQAGAPIEALNTVRRRCDLVKGGGLAGLAVHTPIAVLVISDVLGDDLQAIASGPFTPEAAVLELEEVIQAYRLETALRQSVLRIVRKPPGRRASRTADVEHRIIANIWSAVEAAAEVAEEAGVSVGTYGQPLLGEARLAGPAFVTAWETLGAARPTCFLAGGETTVTVRGSGLGGRNQELALATVQPLAGQDVVLATLATDGGDGPTDAAGAVVGGESLARAAAQGLHPEAFLQRNDAYHFFKPLGDLLQPGPTHTNVNDLTLITADPTL